MHIIWPKPFLSSITLHRMSEISFLRAPSCRSGANANVAPPRNQTSFPFYKIQFIYLQNFVSINKKKIPKHCFRNLSWGPNSQNKRQRNSHYNMASPVTVTAVSMREITKFYNHASAGSCISEAERHSEEYIVSIFRNKA
jgi:hypothetical protein